MSEDTQVVGVRMTQAQALKLNSIAALTGRSKGAVLRLLLDQAHLRSYPDVLLKERDVERLAERA